MRHPLEAVPHEARRRVLVPLLGATALILAAWLVAVAPMSNERAPLSVSSFGTAWTVERARWMMESWDERARISGAFGIGFDFLQLVVYPATFALACAWVAQSLRTKGRKRLAAACVLVAWGQWLAALCGTIQNAVMMALLLGSSPEGWLKVSYFCTILKLLLLSLGPAFALLGFLVARTGRARHASPASA
jgi:hypothetical protein